MTLKMTNRALFPDILRFFALFGIVLVNVEAMASVLVSYPDKPVAPTALDQTAIWFVYAFAASKSFPLFSFMFGVAIGFQLNASKRRGLDPWRSYKRRMWGLILLGVLHGCLFFSGDILTIYGVLGFLFYRFRKMRLRRLIRWGVTLIILGSLLFMLLGQAPLEGTEAMFYADMKAAGAGETIHYRGLVFVAAFFIGLLTQGVMVLGWFCLGYAAYRLRYIQNPNAPIWSKLRRVCFLPGLMLNAVGAFVMLKAGFALGWAIVSLSAPILALGYLGVLAYLVARYGQNLRAIALIGSTSLTIYLGQSILLSLLLSNAGLGLWYKLPPASIILLAVCVTIILCAAVMLWRKRFAMGPFEMVLRRITKGKPA